MEGSSDGWSGESIGGFGASAVCADLGIVEQDDFDFGNVGHFENRIGIPVARRDAAFVEHGFFQERVADAHDCAAFDLPLELHWIDHYAGTAVDGVFFDDDSTRGGSDGDFANAGPVSS